MWLPLQSVRWLNFRGVYLRNVWLPWWLSGKESSCNAGDSGSIPELGRSPGGGNGNPLQFSCLGNPTDRGSWGVTVHRVAESERIEHAHATHRSLSNLVFTELLKVF